MNDNKLKSLVFEAIKLDGLIADLSEQLKLVEKQIKAEAESRDDESTPTEGGGTSIIFKSLDDSICRVTTTGRALRGSIKTNSDDYLKISKAAGHHISELFVEVTSIEPVDKFRDRAKELLGEAPGKKLIKLCENSGKTTISYETKETT